MAAAASQSAKRPGLATVSAAGGMTRWTNAQVQILHDAVIAADTAKAGFAVAAAELGKSVGTVQQKYYALKRASGGGRKRQQSRAVNRDAALSLTRMTSLTIDELTSLAHQVKAEISRRQGELERASSLYN